MPLRADRFGLSVALCTPFNEDRAIDLPRLAAHAAAWSRMRAPSRSLGEAECRPLFAAIDAVRAGTLTKSRAA